MTAKLNRGDYKMEKRFKSLLEARADRDRFKAWGGEELFNLFLKLKDRLPSPENDMTYWTSTRNPRKKEELMDILKRKEKEIEQKETEKNIIKEGAKILFEDDNWLVYEIKNFEACQKYGAGTKWCITGKNMDGDDAYGRRYWDSYTADGNDFYFFLKKGSNEKFAVMIDEGGDHTIFNPQDREIPFIQDAPKVEGLPDVSQDNPKYEEEEEYEDEEPAGPPVPPPFTLEPVANPQAMEFTASSLEDALRQFNNAEFIRTLKDEGGQTLGAVKFDDTKFTLFVFNGRAGGPLMTQRGPGEFALVVFNDVDTLVNWAQQNIGNIQVQDQAAAEQPQQDGEVEESMGKQMIKEGIRLVYNPKEKQEIKEENDIPMGLDGEPLPITIKEFYAHNKLRLFKVK
jgi:hypothetical protein